jgi:two-component system chemotaxis response regulator CheB
VKMIRALLVNCSPFEREAFQRMLDVDPGIEVVGLAPDASAARDLVVERNPDVVVLDVDMPGIDGLNFTRKLMLRRPLPVVVMSSLVAVESDVTRQAIEAGAAATLAKPGPTKGLAACGRELIAIVKDVVSRASPNPEQRLTQHRAAGGSRSAPQLIAVGASTGGAAALTAILGAMLPDSPAILVVIHMPARYTSTLAARIDDLSALAVREAREGEVIRAGTALVAPGDVHMIVYRQGNELRIGLRDSPEVNNHRPSVDVLFRSVAETVGADAVGVLLTGMGDDGARGLLQMREAGGRTLVQDEATSVVFGMPRAALALGAASQTIPLHDIPNSLAELVTTRRAARPTRRT